MLQSGCFIQCHFGMHNFDQTHRNDAAAARSKARSAFDGALTELDRLDSEEERQGMKGFAADIATFLTASLSVLMSLTSFHT